MKLSLLQRLGAQSMPKNEVIRVFIFDFLILFLLDIHHESSSVCRNVQRFVFNTENALTGYFSYGFRKRRHQVSLKYSTWLTQSPCFRVVMNHAPYQVVPGNPESLLGEQQNSILLSLNFIQMLSKRFHSALLHQNPLPALRDPPPQEI